MNNQHQTPAPGAHKMVLEAGRQLLLGLLGIFFVLILYWFSPVQTYAPKGILLPGKPPVRQYHPTQGDKVAVSADSILLKPFTALGSINLEMTYTGNEASSQTQLTQFAQKLAAGLGANLLAIRFAGHTQGDPASGEPVVWVFRARALRVPSVLLAPFQPGMVMPSTH